MPAQSEPALGSEPPVPRDVRQRLVEGLEGTPKRRAAWIRYLHGNEGCPAKRIARFMKMDKGIADAFLESESKEDEAYLPPDRWFLAAAKQFNEKREKRRKERAEAEIQDRKEAQNNVVQEVKKCKSKIQSPVDGSPIVLVEGSDVALTPPQSRAVSVSAVASCPRTDPSEVLRVNLAPFLKERGETWHLQDNMHLSSPANPDVARGGDSDVEIVDFRPAQKPKAVTFAPSPRKSPRTSTSRAPITHRPVGSISGKPCPNSVRGSADDGVFDSDIEEIKAFPRSKTAKRARAEEGKCKLPLLDDAIVLIEGRSGNGGGKKRKIKKTKGDEQETKKRKTTFVVPQADIVEAFQEVVVSDPMSKIKHQTRNEGSNSTMNIPSDIRGQPSSTQRQMSDAPTDPQMAALFDDVVESVFLNAKEAAQYMDPDPQVDELDHTDGEEGTTAVSKRRSRRTRAGARKSRVKVE
ncbi:hypothetical protein DXG01_011144 [Tephrocybe rancida]|nr:hypothetical protein DXG01_011144 [Tephrocybe rancida]